jgi:hypothetical protein
LLAIASKNYEKREEKAHFVSKSKAYDVRERGSAIGEAIWTDRVPIGTFGKNIGICDRPEGSREILPYAPIAGNRAETPASGPPLRDYYKYYKMITIRAQKVEPLDKTQKPAGATSSGRPNRTL